MRHRDHDIALLVPLLDVLEGLGYSLQGETLIDNRPELALKGIGLSEPGDCYSILGAWGTAGQVCFGATEANGPRIPSPIAAPGEAGTRKHPRLAANPKGDALFAWTEGTAWARGGSVAWQMFDAAGRAMDVKGQAAGVPVWSFAAPVARPDGGFVILY